MKLLDIAVPRALAGVLDSRIRIDDVYCDPNSQTDVSVFDRIFWQGEGACQWTRQKRLTKREVGIKLCKARILDASGRRMQLMDVDLWREGLNLKLGGRKKPRSMALSLLRTKYPEDAVGRAMSDEPIVDPVDAHCLDAWRYAVINRQYIYRDQIFERFEDAA